jgi:hypothetical protein
MNVRGVPVAVALGVAYVVLAPAGARAQAPGLVAMSPSPAASPSLSPSPSASPSTAPLSPAAPATPAPSQLPGTWRVGVDAHTTFVSQGSSGPGTAPPEGPGFAQGSPLSPLTPYDVFSSAPIVPGNASESALYLHPAYAGRAFDASFTLGAAYVRGSVTNAAYWGESLLPTLNPHVGARMLPYGIVLPTHAGMDDGTALVASVLSGSIATKDGALALRGGWFDLAQTLPFVFVQPAITSATPSVGITTPETLGDGPPSHDAWTPSSQVLPLHGVDLVAKRGIASAELTDAALPALPGTPARMRSASLVLDHGEGTKYAFAYLDVVTGGDLVSTTVLYGMNPTLLDTPQGSLPLSTIGGQHQRIAGASAAFHASRALDAIVELGRSLYEADHVAEPGTGHPGTYAHAGISRTVRRATASLDLYRNDAYYADALLPYGVPENVWSVAWSWPGQWLKSNYQLINDFPVNINRQGFRVKYAVKGGDSPLDVRVAFASFAQITPITITNALQTGFIDGFFLPQPDDVATLGRQKQYTLFAVWHARFGDVAFDYAEDTMRRPAVAAAPNDAVSYDSPEAVVTFARHVGSRALVTAGVARYGMRGTFGRPYSNVDFAERVGYAGVQLAESPHATALLSLRRTVFGGFPSRLGGPSPDFTATSLVFEQRYHL